MNKGTNGCMYNCGDGCMKEKTKEVDTESGVLLTRNVYHCDVCNKTYHKRTDNVIGVLNDKQWDWVPTKF
jgi:hypothetical protein